MNINNEIKEIFKDHKAHFKDLGEVQILDWKIDNTFCCSIRYIFDSNKLYISGDYGCAVYWLTWNGTPQSFKGINLGYFYEKNAAHEYDEYEFNDKKAREDINYYFEDLLEEYFDEKKEFKENIDESQKNILDIKRKIESLNKEDGCYSEELEELEDQLESEQDDFEYYSDKLNNLEDESKYKNVLEIKDKLLDLVNETNSLSQWAYNIAESNITEDLQEYDCEYWEWIYGIGKAIPERAELHLAGLIMAAEQLEKREVE